MDRRKAIIGVTVGAVAAGVAALFATRRSNMASAPPAPTPTPAPAPGSGGGGSSDPDKPKVEKPGSGG